MRALTSFMRRLERRLGAKLAQRERNRGAALRAALRATPEDRAAADVAGGNVAIIIRSPLGTVEHTLEPGRELLVGSNGASINRPAPAADSGLYKPLRSEPGDVTPATPDGRPRKVALVEAADRRHEWVKLAFDAPRSGHGVLLTEDQARVLREDLRTVLQASDLRRQIAALEKQLAERLAG